MLDCGCCGFELCMAIVSELIGFMIY